MVTIQCFYTLSLTVLMQYAFTESTQIDLTHHPAWNILKKFECGESAADRIIGGNNANLGQFPWIVRLGYIENEGDRDWKCGGALITDRHVVTAAHCLKGPGSAPMKYVRMGEHDVRTNPDCQLNVCAPPVQDRQPKRTKIHPDSENSPFHNDIAIIELDSPVVLNDYVAPICLVGGAEVQIGLKVGELVTVAGWGKMNMTTDERAEILQVVSVPVVEPSKCNAFGSFYQISSSEICAGTQLNKDTCTGDSGGPLMKVFDTPEGPKYFIVGVVSFGPTICGNKKPGVYVSVSYFLKWILDSIM